MPDEIKKMDLRSMDVVIDKIEQLKALFPEVVTEGKVDFEKLKLALGETVETGRERYGLNWAGKADCFKIIQQPSVGTLKPAREESVNFDETENLFIEGDNLEVLKLLQKSYYGKVKMIYIDPPYNTGNDFIYPDNYSESLDTYLKYTGQVDSEGRKYSTNTEADGRFHTRWMNMMYPRLYLAKNLLRDDGVIFIHINDYEMANLRVLCNEIFGEENSLTESPTALIWQQSGTTAGHFANAHEYILVYAKNKLKLPFFALSDYGDDSVISHGALKKISKANPASEIDFPAGIEYDGDSTTFEGEIGGSEKQYITGKMIFKNGKLSEPVTIKAGWAMKDQVVTWLAGEETFDTKGQKVKRFFFNKEGILWYEKERGTIHPKTIIPKEVGSTKTGTKEIESIFGSKIMDFPKPSTLLAWLISFATRPSDIILDFFSGSSTTAHAVLDLNQKENGNRKFIMINLPEPCGEESEAFKAGYKTIADIGKERIRRVIKKIKEKKEGKIDYDESKQDLGFKVLKLDKSNFKIWEAQDVKDPESLRKQMELHVDHIAPESSQDDILYELLLKSGFELTTKIGKIELAGKTVYSIAEGMLLICLDEELTKELIRAMADRKPSRVICLDKGFRNNDQLKTNAVQTMRSKGVEDFLTV